MTRPGIVEEAASAPTTNSRGKWIRITAVFAAVGLVIVVGVLWARARDRAVFDAAVDRHREQGLMVSLEALHAEIPKTSRGLAIRERAWMLAPIPGGSQWTCGEGEFGAFVVGGRRQVPAGLVEDVETRRVWADTLDTLLRDGIQALGGAAHLEMPSLGEGRASKFYRTPIANLLSVYRAASWARRAALLEDDPESALDRLDRIQAALARPVTLLDALIAVFVADDRDGAFLETAISGRLSQDRLQRWLDEDCLSMELCARGVRSERINLISLSRDLRDGLLDASMFTMGSPTLLDQIKTKMSLALVKESDLAIILESAARIERRMRGEVGVRDPMEGLDSVDRGDGLASLVSPRLESVLVGAVTARTRHRAARVMAAVAVHRANTGELPADEAALRLMLGGRSSLLDASHFDQRLVYKVHPTGTVQCSIVANTPVPPILEELGVLPLDGPEPAERSDALNLARWGAVWTPGSLLR